MEINWESRTIDAELDETQRQRQRARVKVNTPPPLWLTPRFLLFCNQLFHHCWIRAEGWSRMEDETFLTSHWLSGAHTHRLVQFILTLHTLYAKCLIHVCHAVIIKLGTVLKNSSVSLQSASWRTGRRRSSYSTSVYPSPDSLPTHTHLL